MKDMGDGVLRFTRNEWSRRTRPLPGYRFLMANDQYIYFLEVK